MRRIPIVNEILPWLLALAAASMILLLLQPMLSLPSLALLVFLAFFFRDPERGIQAPRNSILSPADGRVLEISEVYEEHFLNEPAFRVSIFLSLFDVHINRSPIGGRVVYVNYYKGKFKPAFAPTAAAANERNYIGIESERGRVQVVQIAGILARRIECWVSEDDTVQRGQRIGMIRFGSRTELLMPKMTTAILVKPGDRVKAGETIMGRWMQ